MSGHVRRVVLVGANAFLKLPLESQQNVWRQVINKVAHPQLGAHSMYIRQDFEIEDSVSKGDDSYQAATSWLASIEKHLFLDGVLLADIGFDRFIDNCRVLEHHTRQNGSYKWYQSAPHPRMWTAASTLPKSGVQSIIANSSDPPPGKHCIIGENDDHVESNLRSEIATNFVERPLDNHVTATGDGFVETSQLLLGASSSAPVEETTTMISTSDLTKEFGKAASVEEPLAIPESSNYDADEVNTFPEHLFRRNLQALKNDLYHSTLPIVPVADTSVAVAIKRQLLTEYLCKRTFEQRVLGALRGTNSSSADASDSEIFFNTSELWSRWIEPLAEALLSEKRIRRFFERVDPRIAAGVTIHAVMELLLCPTSKTPADTMDIAKNRPTFTPLEDAPESDEFCFTETIESKPLLSNYINSPNEYRVSPSEYQSLGCTCTFHRAIMAVGRALETEYVCQNFVEEAVDLDGLIKMHSELQLPEVDITVLGTLAVDALIRVATIPSIGVPRPTTGTDSDAPEIWSHLSTVNKIQSMNDSKERSAHQQLLSAPSPSELPVFRYFTLLFNKKHTISYIAFATPGTKNHFLRFYQFKKLHKGRSPAPPMLIPPLPWSCRQNRGAYLLGGATFVRNFRGGCLPSLRNVLRGAPKEAQEVANIATKLGNVPWTINSRILRLIEAVWERGDFQVEKLPPKAELRALMKSRGGTDDPTLLTKIYDCKKRLTSEASMFLSSLHVAQAFEPAPALYFPHFLDFRGRAYVDSPYLNHQGKDSARSLLLFAKGKPLGEEGLRWLKIHVASIWGHDKCSFEDRVAWTEENLPMLRHVAKNPLQAADLWRENEKPFQSVSVAMDLTDALERADPRQYVSNMPIHQDGTCNGLQHYAALGRDIEGARSVNLMPCEGPTDVYTTVAERCKTKLLKLVDGKNGSDKQKLASQILDLDLISRKLVKTTVMTVCYGVTRQGAIEQVKKRMKEQIGLDVLTPKEFTDINVFLSAEILHAVDQLFDRAMQVKKWFNKVSSATSSAGMRVAWMSPIGLPCEQHYCDRDGREMQIKTYYVRVRDTESVDSRKVAGPRQRLGLPPNFVHSLDATHMLKTADKCFKADLAFAAVHDSFWTHAADVPQMNRILREQFVDLYNGKDLISDFRNSLLRRNFKVPPQPPLGDLDVSCVLDSKYFFN